MNIFIPNIPDRISSEEDEISYRYETELKLINYVLYRNRFLK